MLESCPVTHTPHTTHMTRWELLQHSPVAETEVVCPGDGPAQAPTLIKPRYTGGRGIEEGALGRTPDVNGRGTRGKLCRRVSKAEEWINRSGKGRKKKSYKMHTARPKVKKRWKFEKLKERILKLTFNWHKFNKILKFLFPNPAKKLHAVPRDHCFQGEMTTSGDYWVPAEKAALGTVWSAESTFTGWQLCWHHCLLMPNVSQWKETLKGLTWICTTWFLRLLWTRVRDREQVWI